MLGDCEFCEKSLDHKVRPPGDFEILQWSECGQFLAFAGIGAFSQGYVLIAPRRHVTAFGHLSDDEKLKALEFSHAVIDLVQSVWGDCIVFEHGACIDPESVGEIGICINHAHLHIMPGCIERSQFDSRFVVCDFDFQFGKKPQMEDGYYFVGTPSRNEFYVAFGIDLGSQYFRKIMALYHGFRQDWQWDWSIYPRYDLAVKTKREYGKNLFCRIKDDFHS